LRGGGRESSEGWYFDYFYSLSFSSSPCSRLQIFLYRPPKKKNHSDFHPEFETSAPANGGIINSKLLLTQSKQMLLHTNERPSQKMKEGETMAELGRLFKSPLHAEDGSRVCLSQTQTD